MLGYCFPSIVYNNANFIPLNQRGDKKEEL